MPAPTPLTPTPCCRSDDVPGDGDRQHLLCCGQVQRAAPVPQARPFPPSQRQALLCCAAAGEEELAPARLQVRAAPSPLVVDLPAASLQPAAWRLPAAAATGACWLPAAPTARVGQKSYPARAHDMMHWTVPASTAALWLHPLSWTVWAGRVILQCRLAGVQWGASASEPSQRETHAEPTVQPRGVSRLLLQCVQAGTPRHSR
jgi:hypothetical protein